MKTVIFALLTFLGSQAPPPDMPRNNPNGVWVVESGPKFQFQLSGKDLKIHLVDAAKSKYVKYELTLKNQEEINTYKGSGYFVAKLSNGKECRFDTEWNVVVIQPTTAFVTYTRITPNADTCAVLETSPDQMFLKKETDSK